MYWLASQSPSELRPSSLINLPSGDAVLKRSHAAGVFRWDVAQINTIYIYIMLDDRRCQVVGLYKALVQVNNQRGAQLPLRLPYIPPSVSSYHTFPLCAFCIIALKPTSERTGRVKYSTARKRLRRFSAVCSRHCWRVRQVHSRVDRWWQKRRSRPNWLPLWDYKGPLARDGLHHRHHLNPRIFSLSELRVFYLLLAIYTLALVCLLPYYDGVIKLPTSLKF